MRKIWRRKIPIYYFCFIFVLWSQERCFIHAENFHRNKLKLSSCILFGYPRSHCKNAVWCLANRESWMWTGVPEHPLNYFFLGVQSFACQPSYVKRKKIWQQKNKKKKIEKTYLRSNALFYHWALRTETIQYLQTLHCCFFVSRGFR